MFNVNNGKSEDFKCIHAIRVLSLGNMIFRNNDDDIFILFFIN